MNGSMQNAVNKRKATLAAKKAAAAATAAATVSVTPNVPTHHMHTMPAMQQHAQQPPPTHPPPVMAPQGQRIHSFINMNGREGHY